MKKFYVTIDNETGIELEAEAVKVGDTVTGTVIDENGNPVEVTGVVTEIVEEKELWQ